MSHHRTAPAGSESRLRDTLQRVALGVALVGLAGVPLLYLSGGFDVRILGVEVRAHRPLRALSLSGAGLIAFVALGGRWASVRRNAVASVDWLLARWYRVVVPRLPTPRTAAVAIAVVVFLLGAVYATRSAGGSDQYGYVSQADLWLSGRLSIPQPFVDEVPWPRGRETFMPLGYRAVIRDDVPALVPTYSPGLPLMFALVKAVGGHDAIFLVVPLLGGLLVLVTYAIGCRLGSPGAGLIGAALVATSPTVLFMVVPPMTDVPVATLWAGAFYLVTGSGAGNALKAGLVGAVAVMTRPNLVPLAAIAGLFYLTDLRRRESRGRALRHAALFALGVLPGVIAVGAINNNLYGSPVLSGYGRLSDLFAWAHIEPNFRRYFTWLVETQSPVALAGLAALLLPVRWLWPGLRDRRRLVLAALFVYSVWAQYLAYLVFDAWWYLRFLLIAWPFMMVGVGAVAMAIWRPAGPVTRAGVAAGVMALASFQTYIVEHRSVIGQWSEERRYVSVAHMVQRLTPPNSVILSMQHSGTIRYYGGRMTMRYDFLETGWIDRVVAWLGDRGVRTYLAAEPWELPDVRRQFGTSAAAAKLDAPPLAIYERPGMLILFDLSGAPHGPTEMVTGVDRSLRAAPPGPAPTLVFQPRPN